MLFSAVLTAIRKEEKELARPSHRWATALRLEGCYPTPTGAKAYQVQRVPLAFGLMAVGGALSGLLGIGSGAVKVLAMDQAMRLPYKVATATSNFLIGITAATSAGIYFKHGYIDPTFTFPVLLGVLAGSLTGARILAGASHKRLRFIFSVAIAALALQMIYKSVAGGL